MLPCDVRTLAKATVLTGALAVACLLIHPAGPYGGFWPPSPLCPLPNEAEFPFFAFVAIVEATAFGLGVSWFVWGYPVVARIFGPLWHRLVIYISTGWQLVNWFPHDSLHINVGPDLGDMILLELGFHVTLVISAALVALVYLLHARRVCK